MTRGPSPLPPGEGQGEGPHAAIDAALVARAARVELLIFDVDGVLTDGGLYYGATGEVLKRFDVKDGHALVMARLTGLKAAVITSRSSEIVAVRCRELGFAAVIQGRRDKRAALTELLAHQGLSPEACAYMGDDTTDLGPLSAVGLPACPADAIPEVRRICAFVSTCTGGRGAARELVELCLKASGRWDRALALTGGLPTG